MVHFPRSGFPYVDKSIQKLQIRICRSGGCNQPTYFHSVSAFNIKRMYGRKEVFLGTGTEVFMNFLCRSSSDTVSCYLKQAFYVTGFLVLKLVCRIFFVLAYLALRY